jgi:hypothetical protein
LKRKKKKKSITPPLQLESSPIRDAVEVEEVLEVPHQPLQPQVVSYPDTSDDNRRPGRAYPMTSSTSANRYRVDNRDLDQDEEFLRDRRVSDIFCEERVAPILKTSAEIGGLECMEEGKQVRPNSLIYGSLGHYSKPSPILTMPNELATETDIAREKKGWYKGPNHTFESVFRVTDAEYKNVFVSPALDPEVDSLPVQIFEAKTYSVFQILGRGISFN